MQKPSSCRILIVEDEGLIAHDIAKRLETLGHRVHGTASTADEALEQAPGADLVLMDIRIDGPIDGVEAAREIRNRHHIPVVFLTAHADRNTLARAKQSSPFGYIVKPLAPAAIETSIEMAVYKHGLERQLEEREAWLRTTVASAADAVLVCDVDGYLRTMNPAAERLTGWDAARAVGQPLSRVLRLIEAESGEDYGDVAPLALLNGEPLILDRSLHLVRAGGDEAEVEGSAAPVTSGSEVLGVVVLLRDVTARRWEERQLRQAQRLETAGRLAARVSAEFGGLIESVRRQTDRLLDQLGDYAPVRDSLEEIQRSAMMAAQTTRRLTEFGTRQVAHPELLSLNGTLRRIHRLLLSAAGPKTELTVRPRQGIGRIRADLAQLEQAILNLVLHAAAAMPEGGELSIETDLGEAPRHGILTSYAILRVRYAASEPDLEHVFEPGGASEASLALPVTHSIVTEHGGHLCSRSDGDATIIEILLPRAEEAVSGTTLRAKATFAGSPVTESAVAGEGEAPQETALASSETAHAHLPAASTPPELSPQPAGGPDASSPLPPAGTDRAAEVQDDEPHAAGEAPAILLIDCRDRVRAQLHNFFEAAGYNLLEAASRDEAVALCQVRDGRLDLLIGDQAEVDPLIDELDEEQRPAAILKIVHRPVAGADELCHPFSQHQLLAKAESILGRQPAGKPAEHPSEAAATSAR